MTISPMNRLVDHIRQVALLAAGDHATDGRLLDQFINERDEAAFEALTRRHGPMVFGVCRRVIGNNHDAEDAFQATFLVLVRKAASVRPREAVGNWLHGVAYRTALEARARLARRRSREQQVVTMPQPHADAESSWHDLRPVLDQELTGLPDHYRLPVILCDLEGRARKQVARQLRIAEGTLSSRLATARKLLARRLRRRGVTLSIACLTSLLAQGTVSAAVPASLLVSTTNVAMLVAAGQAVASGTVPVKVAALTEGVLKMMFLTKLKLTAMVVSGVAVVGLGTGGLLYQARGADSMQHDTAPSSQLQLVQRNAQADDQETPRRAQNDADAIRNRELRRQLDQARAQAEAARAAAEAAQAEAAAQRERAEAERQRAEVLMRRAESELQRARKAEQDARRSAQKQGYANALQQADRALNSRTDTQDARLRYLDQQRSAVMKEMAEQKARLKAELRNLEDQQRSMLGKFEQDRADLTRVDPKQPSARERMRSRSAEDGLSRILERLDRIEQRLQRLESR